ncbi:MAG: cupin domain-containing protein [Micromonosporaceae bacterium]
MPKPEREFFNASQVEWTPCAGDVAGLDERILSADPDGGVATRMLRFGPGVDTTPNGVQVHDFWEEVYILDGSIRDLELDETFTAGMYACRPPGMKHGPWVSPEGCVTFEARYRSSGDK